MPKVTMPQLGESVAEGTIGKWLKVVGDRVEKYEPLVEVITDKVNAEVPSPFAGTLTAILVEEGQTVPNNAEIAEIDGDGAAATDGAAPSGAARVSTPAVEAAPSAPVAHGPAGSDERPVVAVGPAPARGRSRAGGGPRSGRLRGPPDAGRPPPRP